MKIFKINIPFLKNLKFLLIKTKNANERMHKGTNTYKEIWLGCGMLHMSLGQVLNFEQACKISHTIIKLKYSIHLLILLI